MKKTLLLVSGLLLAGFASQAQWVAQPLTFSNTVQAPYYFSAVSSSLVWVAGSDAAGGGGGGNQFARTFDGGTNWTVGTIANLTADETITGIVGLSGTTALVCTARNAGGRILKTVNAGATWTVQTTATQFGTAGVSFPNYIAFFNATEGVCVGDPISTRSEIYTTSDAGNTWTAVPTAGIPTSPSTETGIVRRFAVFGNSFWFSTTTGRVFYSSNKGQTWAVSSSGITTSVNNALALSFRDASNGIAVVPPVSSGASRLTRTTDGGATWQVTAFTGPLHNAAIDNVPGTNQFISVGYAAGDLGSSYSRDNGTTWTAIESTRTFAAVEAFDATNVWAGATTAGGAAGAGVYKLTSTVLSSSKDAALQRGLSVYPNPSTGGQFKVELASGRGAEAQVTVSDALGRSVYARTVRTAASPEFALDLGRAKAGVYTLQVRTEGGVAQQKIVVE